jgi:RHH-type proline utilization regulon transcriptional repressor/proline dehydrogenase/delta 1-pyrroline-5-carboxylate dehydrogenase
VRRLLENGANSSFVHRIGDPAVPSEELIADPAEVVRAMPHPGAAHDAIALPCDLFADRRNSAGLDLTDETALAALSEALRQSAATAWSAAPQGGTGEPRPVLNPGDHRDIVGSVIAPSAMQARAAVQRAAASRWGAARVAERAAILDRAADAMQARLPILLGLIMREAGKTAPNAIAEVREAVDFLRYYAAQIRSSFAAEQKPLGPIACISPWNFPLSIFTGQVAAALAAGNPVVAKPAEETPLIAAEAVRLLHEAGVPADALQFLPGDGETGAALVAAPETAAVMFTGSTEVARLIQQQLCERLSPAGQPIPLIAETGGQNAMIVDSSALAEQVVADVMSSAFDSAGQRCSALRVLCLQEDIADRTLAMVKGALRELRLGNTDRLAVDIGPVISAEAQARLERHIAAMRERGRRVEQQALPPEATRGTFVPPTIIEIESLAELTHEIFGPVLHVVRYARDALDALVAQINASGYGLTFGLHTRLDGMVAQVTARVQAGNHYVNRNIIGAVVGVQPFGGRGLSGTGPKAGGPLYLGRLVDVPPKMFARASAPPLLRDFADWLEQRGEAQAAGLARRYGAAPFGIELTLPGPVGERNVYRLHPRGRILLQPQTETGLYAQMAAVLATGNRGRVQAMGLPEDLPAKIAAVFADVVSTPPAAILVEGDAAQVMAALHKAAAMAGPIVPVHAARADTPLPYACEWLLEEVSTSINTTAAGGNASLMMIG